MRVPFFGRRPEKTHDTMVAVDLGGRTTKAVHLERRGEEFVLRGYALFDAPVSEKGMSAAVLAERLKQAVECLQVDTKLVTLTVGSNDVLVRSIETPMLSIDELRSVLKLSSKQYLQQELPGYVFDGHVILYFNEPDSVKSGAAAKRPKQRVLVAGVKNQLLEAYVQGAKAAGLNVCNVVPGLIGPVNALERAMPGPFAAESIGIVDIGFKSSTIAIVKKGEFALSRVIAIGGDRLTMALTESMKISYAEAEGIKIGMPTEVRADLESALVPLGREIRASIDYFEHHHDTTVNRVLTCGGSAQSELVNESLQTELMLPCGTWDPTAGMQQEISNHAGDVANIAPQLAVAVGAALGAM